MLFEVDFRDKSSIGRKQREELECYSCKQLLKDSNLTFTLTLKVNICSLAHGLKDKFLRADR